MDRPGIPFHSGRKVAGSRGHSSAITLALGLCTLVAFVGARAAAAQTWVGDGSNMYWDVASNWSPAVVPGSGADVTNNTAFTVNYRQNTDTVDSYTSSDDGGFLMSGGILNLIAAFTTNGDYTQTGGTLTAASFTTSSSFTLSGGTMDVASFTSTGSGPLTLSGGTLDDTGNLTTSSTLTLNGGTIQNATIVNPYSLRFGNSTSNVLDNVTLAGTEGLNVNGTVANQNAIVRVADGITLNSYSSINIGTSSVSGSNAYLLIDSTSGTPNPTINNTTISLGAFGNNLNGYLGFGNGFTSANTLTFGNGLSVEGQGTIGAVGLFTNTGANLVNNGLITPGNFNQTLNVVGAMNGNITNNGTIDTFDFYSTLNLTTSGSGSLTNTGMLEATGTNSTFTINCAGTGAINNYGTISAAGSAVVYLEGTVNTLGTLSATSSGVIALNGATVTGTISPASQSALSFGNSTNNILDNVTLSGSSPVLNVNGFDATFGGSPSNAYVRIADSFTFAAGATFNIGTGSHNAADYLLFDSTAGTPNPVVDNAVVNLGNGGGPESNPANFNFGFGNGFTSANTLTFGSGLTIQGSGTVGSVGVFSNTGANLVNNGTISSNDEESYLYVTGATNGNITNNGTIQAIGSTLELESSGTGTVINNGLLQANEGQLDIDGGRTGGFDNNGTISTSNGGTVFLFGNINSLGTLNVTSGSVIALLGATVTGTISAAEQSSLSFGDSLINVFDNVTLTGNNGLTITGTTPSGNIGELRIADSFNFTPGATFNLGTTTGGSGYLFFDSTTGTPNPVFNNAIVNLGNIANGSSCIGEIGFGYGFANNGNTLTLGQNLTVQGIGNIGVESFLNTGANLVNDGTISANDSSTVALAVSGATNGNITNNGTIQSDANGSTMTISANGTGVLTNNGTIQAINKGNATISGPSFVNAGTLQVNSGSTLAVNSTTSTQSAGATVVNGAMTLGTSDTGTYTVSGGSLYGTGTIAGYLNNTGGTVGAGIRGATPTTGTLALNGSYDQSAGAVFSAALGGTTQGSQFDFFTVSGTAILGGYLDIDLINGFIPTFGETFQIIKDTDTTGTFSNATGNVVEDDSGKYMFGVIYSAGGVTLTSEGGSMPEPGAGRLLFLAVIPGALTGLARRRTKRKYL